MVIGFPVLYLELALGQFARAGPATVYGRMKPAFQGEFSGRAYSLAIKIRTTHS